MESRRVFLSVSAIVFVASAAMTIASCASMSAMGAMEMPGGWAMSMMWMPGPGQTWLGATASFVGMWVVMMVAMMLPSLTPMLWRYRESLGRTNVAGVGWLTALVGVGYFAVWAVLGVIVFVLGSVLAAIAMEKSALAGAVPIVVGAAVLIAGVLQQTGWKARQLAFCREAPGGRLAPHVDAGAAWRHGLRLGLHCSQSCAGLTLVVLALGVMDLRVMVVVAAATTAERLAPNGVRVARAIGVFAVALGVVMMARAAGSGDGSRSRVSHSARSTHPALSKGRALRWRAHGCGVPRTRGPYGLIGRKAGALVAPDCPYSRPAMYASSVSPVPSQFTSNHIRGPTC